MSRLAQDAAIAQRGIDALSRSLGPAHTRRFLTLLRPPPTDYVRISRRIYAKQTVDKIFERSSVRVKRR